VGSRIVPQRDLLAMLRRRELDAVAARLSAETGSPYTPAAGGEMVAGTYRQRLTLTSGRFAMIDNGLGFTLVPWTSALDRHLGRHVSGVAKGGGGIEWSFGRKRGLGVSDQEQVQYFCATIRVCATAPRWILNYRCSVPFLVDGLSPSRRQSCPQPRYFGGRSSLSC
jgi:hypothetical protein